MNVDQPKFMAGTRPADCRQTPLADWKVYLKWHLLNSTASSLSAAFVEEDFAFNGKYLSGSHRNEAALEAVRGVDRSVFG